jgi:hypothetical protein
VLASLRAKLIRIKASAIVINPGSKIKLGKYPGFNAATPSKQVLDMRAIVALYEEILSENLLSGDKYESDTESSSKPNIQPSSVIEPNLYVELSEDQRKNRSDSAKDNKPPDNSKERIEIGVSKT